MSLVLSRKTDEAIHIGTNILIKIVRIQNGKVKLAIESPKEVAIVRDELLFNKTKHEIQKILSRNNHFNKFDD